MSEDEVDVELGEAMLKEMIEETCSEVIAENWTPPDHVPEMAVAVLCAYLSGPGNNLVRDGATIDYARDIVQMTLAKWLEAQG